MTLQSPGFWLLAIPLLLGFVAAYRQLGRTRLLRLGMLLLIVLALSDPRIEGGPGRARTIVLIDRSESVRGAGVERGRALAEQLAETELGAPLLLGFGRGASVLVAPGEPLDALQSLPAQDDSDLTAGLRLAMAQAATLGAAEVIVVSDGLYTGDDPRAEAAALRARGLRVHAMPLSDTLAGDVAITRLSTPGEVAAGQPFSLGVQLHAPRARDAELVLRDGHGHVLQHTALRLQAGSQHYAVPVPTAAAGLQTLEVQLQVRGDPRPENNRARGVVSVVGPPRLWVFNPDGAETALVRALRSTGLSVEVRSGFDGASGAGLGSADLLGVAAVVLENLPLSALGDGADRALSHYVRQMGGGLLVTGGRRSFAMGGYFRSALDGLLPVVMDRQEELRRPRIDMAVALDRSGSMTAMVAHGATKMDLANRGAAEAVALLAPGDRIAVFAVDTAAHTVVPLTELGEATERRETMDKVLAIESSGGGIYVHTALAAAMDALLAGEANTRHIILFSDAADSEEPGDYRSLIARWVEAGGSLSVIGLGTEADPDAALLAEMAKLGGGQVYFTADALSLPRIFAQDVTYVARKTFVEQRTPMLPARGLVALGFTAPELEPVDGYNLSFLAKGAEAMLVSGDGNAAPLAAGVQRGTGKVAAVTFEADGPFTGPFASSAHYKGFFRHLTEWVRAQNTPADAAATMVLQGRRAVIEVELGDDAPGAPEVQVLTPDGRRAHKPHLGWTGPRTLRASVPVDSSGVFHGVVTWPGRAPLQLPPVMLPYSPEFEVSKDGLGGAEVLERLARATGGGTFHHVDELVALSPLSVPAGLPLRPWLVGLLLALLLVDIAWRRGLLDPLAQVGGRVVAPVVRAAGRLRHRRPRTRGRPATAEPPPPSDAAGGAVQQAEPPADKAEGTGAEATDPLALAKRRARGRR